MMKKIIFGLLTYILLITPVNASEKIEVTLKKCVDGDTAWFILDGEEIKTRFLAIDTPESTTKTEEYGKEASEYVCNLLTVSEKIEIQYDSNSDKLDKYNRHLVWVFVNDELLQEKIVENGLAEVAYLYGDYKYTDDLKRAQESAMENKLGIWSEVENSTISPIYIFLTGIVILLIFIFSKSGRKKIINKTKSSIKKQIKKTYKK